MTPLASLTPSERNIQGANEIWHSIEYDNSCTRTTLKANIENDLPNSQIPILGSLHRLAFSFGQMEAWRLAALALEFVQPVT